MEEKDLRWEQWAQVLAEIEGREQPWTDIDPASASTEELLESLLRSLRDEAIFNQFRREFIAELADRQIREWLDSAADLPDWFALRSGGSGTGDF